MRSRVTSPPTTTQLTCLLASPAVPHPSPLAQCSLELCTTVSHSLTSSPLFGMCPPSSGPEPQPSGALPSEGSLFSQSLHCRAKRWNLSLLFLNIISSPLFPSAWKALHLNTPTSSYTILSLGPCGLPAFPYASSPSESSASASSSFSLPHFLPLS